MYIALADGPTNPGSRLGRQRLFTSRCVAVETWKRSVQLACWQWAQLDVRLWQGRLCACMETVAAVCTGAALLASCMHTCTAIIQRTDQRNASLAQKWEWATGTLRGGADR